MVKKVAIYFSVIAMVWMCGWGESMSGEPTSGEPSSLGTMCEKRETGGYVCQYQKEPSDRASDLENAEFQLVRLYDSQFQSIAHMELRTSKPLTRFPEKIEWEITGGRYHILETELPAVSYFQPFQKTILFKEKVSYRVTVRVYIKGEWRQESLDIHLTGLEGDSLKPILDLERLEARPGETIKFWGEVPEKVSHAELEIRRSVKKECSKEALALEDPSSLPVRMAMEHVCGLEVEEPLTRGGMYDMISAHLQQGVLQFKVPGKFIIVFRTFSQEGDPLGEASRRIQIENQEVVKNSLIIF